MLQAKDLAKKLVASGFFKDVKTAKTTLKYFTPFVGKGIDHNNLTPGQALEIMLKVGYYDFENMCKIITESIIEENKSLRSENDLLKGRVDSLQSELKSAQQETLEGLAAKDELNELRNGLMNLLMADSTSSKSKPTVESKELVAVGSETEGEVAIEEVKDSNLVPKDSKEPEVVAEKPEVKKSAKKEEPKAKNIYIMLNDEEKAWFKKVSARLSKAKCGWAPLQTTYKRMHDVYKSDIEEARKAFLAEYPLDLYGPMKCSSLTAIAHDKDMRDTFERVFPGVLEEYKLRKAEREAK